LSKKRQARNAQKFNTEKSTSLRILTEEDVATDLLTRRQALSGDAEDLPRCATAANRHRSP
jgi:hypothetical protein